ncbi:uncharacterized protein PHACADRAFT_192608 [Phanerochaete carnosa HHB-10118-sp]|uniref:Uncharacterized protein n=1 Tax=Phanerochaete carnosa (strain HHB-10118-sp) TaxID=650164 RepID=K5WDV1_PHACS|nr:uncharacterized protein PHACADRAFT_192608 [Phanerochaete carnosa HHB-10118-sp]EKM57460.1 hypothetical protein PHACADRAFT_192608 [Phanerochaete carnosa HHB-10118-sp]
MSLNTAAKHPETKTFDEGLVQRYPPLASSRRTNKQSIQPDKAPPSSLATSGYRDAIKTENQRGKKRAREVEDVKEEDVDEEPRKRHAANKEKAAPGPSEYDDDDEGFRPKRNRRRPPRPSFCHPSCHVENRDGVHAAGAANVPIAAPAAVVALPAPVQAAPVAAPMPAAVALAAQPAQGAFVVIPPPLAALAPPAPTYLPPIAQVLADLPNPPYNIVLPPIDAHQHPPVATYLPPIVQVLAGLPNPPYNIALPPIVAHQPAITQNPRMQLGFIMM